MKRMATKPTIEEMLRRADKFVKIAKEHARSDDAADRQNAAAKAWMAARMSALAVVECQTGYRPRGTETLRARLKELATAPGASSDIKDFRADFGDAFAGLHIECSEEGICDGRLLGRVYDVADRIVPTAHKVCKR